MNAEGSLDFYLASPYHMQICTTSYFSRWIIELLTGNMVSIHWAGPGPVNEDPRTAQWIDLTSSLLFGAKSLGALE